MFSSQKNDNIFDSPADQKKQKLTTKTVIVSSCRSYPFIFIIYGTRNKELFNLYMCLSKANVISISILPSMYFQVKEVLVKSAPVRQDLLVKCTHVKNLKRKESRSVGGKRW